MIKIEACAYIHVFVIYLEWRETMLCSLVILEFDGSLVKDKEAFFIISQLAKYPYIVFTLALIPKI